MEKEEKKERVKERKNEKEQKNNKEIKNEKCIRQILQNEGRKNREPRPDAENEIRQ